VATQVVGVSSSHVMVRSRHSIDECCGGRDAAECRYLGLRRSEGATLSLLRIDARPVPLEQATSTFPIVDSVFRLPLCTSAEVAAQRLARAKEAAAAVGLTLDATMKAPVSIDLGRSVAMTQSTKGDVSLGAETLKWTSSARVGFADKRCTGFGCAHRTTWEVTLEGAVKTSLTILGPGQGHSNVRYAKRIEVFPVEGGHVVALVFWLRGIGSDNELPSFTFVPRQP